MPALRTVGSSPTVGAKVKESIVEIAKLKKSEYQSFDDIGAGVEEADLLNNPKQVLRQTKFD